jgi:hypothetical protein
MATKRAFVQGIEVSLTIESYVHLIMNFPDIHISYAWKSKHCGFWKYVCCLQSNCEILGAKMFFLLVFLTNNR